MSAIDRPAAELTVVDVYDIAAVLGQEFERIIDRFGCESLVGVVPKVVRVLELLEALVSRGAAGHEAAELRAELERLRRERSDRCETERKHQKELEMVEDVWRGEVQDLLSQIGQLQSENKKLLVSLSLQESPVVTEEDLQRQHGMSEKEKQVMTKLNDLVDKQRDEIRAKELELTMTHEDLEALQMQQQRLMRINQDLRHRVGVMEGQGKLLVQQRAQLEAAAQARQQELASTQQELARLRKELRDLELDRAVAELEEHFPSKSRTSPPASPQKTSSAAAAACDSIRTDSVWVECREDPGFLQNCCEPDKSLSRPTSGGTNEEEVDGGEDTPALSLLASTDSEQSSGSERDSDSPRFTLQELRDVLQERNELKSQVFLLQEELAYYKCEELEEDAGSVAPAPSPPPSSASNESGIRRLLFTAIMPMVAAGLLSDDPTLLPIRRLSLV